MGGPEAKAIYDMPAEEYHAAPGINATSIKAGRTSMKHMHACMTHTSNKTSAAMEWGTHIHSAILEPDTFFSSIVTYDGTRKGKKWDAFKEEAGDAQILKPNEQADLVKISNSVHSNPDAHRLVERTKHEVSLFYNGENMGACKARLDGYDPSVGMLEVKSTGNVDKAAFARTTIGMGYLLQLAWYAGACCAVFGDWPPVHIVCIEQKDPFDCVVYRVDEKTLSDPFERAFDIARMYHIQEYLGRFEGVADGIVEFEVPAWAVGNGNPVELVIGGESVEI